MTTTETLIKAAAPPIELDVNIIDTSNPEGTTDTRTASLVVARHTTILMVGQIITQASMAIIGILIARTMGQTRYGEYALAFAFVGIFGLLFSLGVDSIVVREVARWHGLTRLKGTGGVWYVFSSGFWLRIISFPLATAVITVAAALSGYTLDQRVLILLVAVMTGVSSLIDLIRAMFQGQQRMMLDTVTRLIEKPIALLIIIGLLLAGYRSLTAIAGALLAGAVLGLIVAGVLLLRINPEPRLWHPKQSLHLIKRAAPVGGSMFIISLYLQLPAVMLSWFLPIHMVGLYTAANGVVAPFLLLPVAMGSALLPVLTGTVLKASDRSELETHYLVTLIFIAVALPILAILTVFGTDIIRLLYGPEFLAAKDTLVIMAPMIPLVFANTYLTNFLIARHQQKMLLFVTLQCLIFTVVGCLLMIPSFSYRGAAAARVIAETSNIALMLYLTRRWILKHRSAA